MTIDNHTRHIAKHYTHAREKHPYFADALSFLKPEEVIGFLASRREMLGNQIDAGEVFALSVLDCEILEAEAAIVEGRTDEAIEECYDAVAVLLRMVDVLRGQQALGDPNGGGPLVTWGEDDGGASDPLTEEERRDDYLELCADAQRDEEADHEEA